MHGDLELQVELGEQVETLHVGNDHVMRLSGSPVLDFAAYHDSTWCCQLAEVAAEIGVIDNCIGWRPFAEPG